MQRLRPIPGRKGILLLIACMACISSLSLAPPSRLEDVLSLLKALSFKNGQTLLKAIEYVEWAQKAEMVGRHETAQKHYIAARGQLMQALSINRTQLKGAAATYGQGSKEPRNLIPLLDLDEDYQQLYAVWQAIHARVTSGKKPEIPEPMDKPPSFFFLEDQVKILNERIADDTNRGNNALADQKAQWEEWYKILDSLTKELQLVASMPDAIVHVSRGERGETVVNIPQQEEVNTKKSYLEKTGQRVQALQSSLQGIPVLDVRVLQRADEIPAFHKIAGGQVLSKEEETMDAVVRLQVMISDLRLLAAKGTLDYLLSKEEKKFAAQRMQERRQSERAQPFRRVERIEEAHEGPTRAEMLEKISLAQGIVATLSTRFQEYRQMVQDMVQARKRIVEERVVETLAAKWNTAEPEFLRQQESVKAAQRELKNLIATAGVSVGRVKEQYARLIDLRSEYRKTATGIAAKRTEKIKISDMPAFPPSRVARFLEMRAHEGELRAMMGRLAAYQRDLIRLERELDQGIQRAVSAAVRDTDEQPKWGGILKVPTGQPLSAGDYLTWYGGVMDRSIAFLRSFPDLIAGIRRVHEQCEAVPGKLVNIDTALQGVDTGLVELESHKLLRGRKEIRHMLDSRAGLRRERDACQVHSQNLVAHANLAIASLTENPKAAVSLAAPYETLSENVQKLSRQLNMHLGKWKTVQPLIGDMETKLATLKENTAAVKKLMALDMIRKKAEEENQSDVLADDRPLHTQWDEFLVYLRGLVLNDQAALAPEWNQLARAIEARVNDTVTATAGFMEAYTGMLDWWQSDESLRKAVKASDKAEQDMLGKAGELDGAMKELQDLGPLSEQEEDRRAGLIARREKYRQDTQEMLQRLAQDRTFLWEAVRLPKESSDADRQEYEELAISDLQDKAEQLGTLIQEDEALRAQVQELVQAVQAQRVLAEEPAGPPPGPVAGAPEPAPTRPSGPSPEISAMAQRLKARLEETLAELEELLRKYPVAPKAIRGFARQDANIQAVLLRLEKRGEKELQLAPEEITALQSIVRDITNRSLKNANDIVSCTGVKLDPEIFLFLLHRALSPPRVLEVYASTSSEKEMSTVPAQIKPRMEEIAQEYAAVGITKEAMQVTVIQNQRPLGGVTGLTPQKTGVRTTLGAMFKPAVRAKLQGTGSLYFDAREIPMAQDPAVSSDPKFMKNLISSCEKMNEGKNQKLLQSGSLTPEERMRDPDSFRDYVLPELLPYRPTIENLWKGLKPVEVANQLIPVEALLMAMEAMNAGDLSRTALHMEQHYSSYAQTMAGPAMIRLRERYQKARIEEPDKVFVMAEEERMAPVIKWYVEGGEIPDSLGHLTLGEETVIRQTAAWLKGQSLEMPDKECLFARVFIELALEQWCTRVLHKTLAESRPIIRSIVEQLEWEDVEEIAAMFSTTPSTKRNTGLIVWLMQRRPSLMDASTRQVLLPDPVFYHCQLAEGNAQLRRKAILEFSKGNKSLASALAELAYYDFLQGLGKEESERFTRENRVFTVEKKEVHRTVVGRVIDKLIGEIPDQRLDIRIRLVARGNKIDPELLRRKWNELVLAMPDGILRETGDASRQRPPWKDLVAEPAAVAAAIPVPPGTMPAVQLDTKLREKYSEMAIAISQDKEFQAAERAFFYDGANLASLKSRLASNGMKPEMLGLSQDEVQALCAWADAVWGARNDRDLLQQLSQSHAWQAKLGLGFTPDPKRLLFILHRLVSHVAVLDIYAEDKKEEELPDIGQQVREKIEALRRREEEAGLNPNRIKVLIVRTLRVVTDATSVAFEEKFEKIGALDPLRRALEQKIISGQPEVLPEEYVAMAAAHPKAMKFFEEMVAFIRQATEQMQEGWASRKQIPRAEVKDEPFLGAVLPEICRYPHRASSPLIYAGNLESLNSMSMDFFTRPMQGFLDQGKLSQALQVQRQYNVHAVKLYEKPILERLAELVLRQSILDPDTVIVFSFEDFMEPLVQNALHRKPIGDSWPDLPLRSEALLAEHRGQSVTDELSLARILMESGLAFHLRKVSELPYRSLDQVARRVVETLSLEDVQEIFHSVAARKTDKENIALILATLSRNSWGLGEELRRHLLPSAAQYHAQAILSQRDLLLDMAKGAKDKEGRLTPLGEALSILIFLDHLRDLEPEEQKEFVRILNAQGGKKYDRSFIEAAGQKASQDRTAQVDFAVQAAKENALLDMYNEISKYAQEHIAKKETPMFAAMMSMALRYLSYRMTQDQYNEFFVNLPRSDQPLASAEPGTPGLNEKKWAQEIGRLHDLDPKIIAKQWGATDSAVSFSQKVKDVYALETKQVLTAWQRIWDGADPWVFSKDRPLWKDLIAGTWPPAAGPSGIGPKSGSMDEIIAVEKDA